MNPHAIKHQDHWALIPMDPLTPESLVQDVRMHTGSTLPPEGVARLIDIVQQHTGEMCEGCKNQEVQMFFLVTAPASQQGIYMTCPECAGKILPELPGGFNPQTMEEVDPVVFLGTMVKRYLQGDPEAGKFFLRAAGPDGPALFGLQKRGR